MQTVGVLTAADVRRLTLWKWRYSLEGQGFMRAEAERLVFMRWAAHYGVIGEG